MVRPAIPAWLGRRLGRPLLLACLLGLALLLGHQFVMASARHAMAMGTEASRHRVPALAAWPVSAALVAASVREHRGAPTGGEECLAQLGTLPLMLLLLALVGLRGRSRPSPPTVAAPHPWSRPARRFHPPPLAPSRRRALLQVFLV